MAAQLKKDLDLETELVVGSSGEFTVWLGDRMVVQKDHGAFPEPAAVVTAIRAAQQTS